MGNPATGPTNNGALSSTPVIALGNGLAPAVSRLTKETPG